MNAYTQWDYISRSYNADKFDNAKSFSMADSTKIEIYDLFKEDDLKKITDFLTWLKEDKSSFMFSHRDFIFTLLVEFKHFSIADDFCSIKPYKFDEKNS